MASLTAITADKHAGLKVSANRAVIYASGAHIMPLRVTEIAHAIVDFPVLMSRTGSTGDISLSALTSFEPGRNLFVAGETWDSSFQSAAMKTYPVYLMRAEDGGSDPVLGLDAGSAALGQDEGEALLDSKGKPSLWLSQIRAQLLEDSRNTVHTFQFLGTLQSLNLIRPVDIAVNYVDGEVSRIRGLSTIHEDNLQSLSAEQLVDLRDKNYLAPIYAMLFSLLQLNALIRRNNHASGARAIKNINLEVTKNNSA